MNKNRMDKLKTSLEELENKINNLLDIKPNDAKLERFRKHKKVMREVEEYYSKKVQ